MTSSSYFVPSIPAFLSSSSTAICRFSPQQQAASGRIGGTIQTPAKLLKYKEKQGPVVKKCIETGSTWINQETNERLFGCDSTQRYTISI